MWQGLLVTLGLLLAVGTGSAQSRYSADTGECGTQVSSSVSTFKTSVRSASPSNVRMYGVLDFRHNHQDAREKHCHVVYHLFVSSKGRPFREAYRLPWDTEQGEIAGIDLIGFSPNRNKAAANFLLAEGDGQVNRAVVYDFQTKTAKFSEIPQVEDRRPTRNTCDYGPYESLDSVNNAGFILISVPPYEGCADGGLWLFDPRTASVKQIRLNSGRMQ